jgi:putative tryptophan/tyrosine transport system substrate-binding protein
MGITSAPLSIEQRLLILAAAMQAENFTRRYFLSCLGGAAAWPLTASAQWAAGKIVTVGILASEPWPPIETFRRALDDLGYIEGKNIRFEYRYAKGYNERFPELANELVGLNVDLILTWGTDAALAAKQATTTIPIVMGAIGDPLGIGIVTNLAHPGANITGFSSRAAELEAKRLQLLKEVVPGLSRVAILFNPTNHYMPLALQSARKGAQMLHVSLAMYEIHDTTTLDAAFVTLTKDRPDALMVPADTFLVSQRSRIAQFAIENKLPSVYTFREYIEAGGLIAYTPDYDDLFRRAANYVDKILKGTKPGELPIELPTRFHLLINLKTARTLGFTLPPWLLARADEVIE